MRLNILVVSENFIGGGLETHIHSYIEVAQARLQERLQVHEQLLGQLREQTEYHRKILAPLIWMRRFLFKIKRKIKSCLR